MSRTVSLLPDYDNRWNFSTLTLYTQPFNNLGFMQGFWFLLSTLHEKVPVFSHCMGGTIQTPSLPRLKTSLHSQLDASHSGYNFHHRDTGGNMKTTYVIFIYVRN